MTRESVLTPPILRAYHIITMFSIEYRGHYFPPAENWSAEEVKRGKESAEGQFS